MNLEQVWQQNSGRDDDLNKFLDTANFSKIQSRIPLKKIRTNLLIGIVFAALINIVYIVLLYLFSIWQVYISLGVLIIFNIFLILDSWKLHNTIPATITANNSLKNELSTHYHSIQRWWTLQQKISLFIYPVALTGGFILGGVLGSGKPAEAFLYNSRMLSILGLIIILMVPICYFGSQWMFNQAYGKHLKKLKSAIEKLS